ncbi:MAG: transglycosylase SLT domain-containing protein [Bacteroidales bacterium]|nr:transglycosylase SLT domain-containing protein [Bacteroidales bacterium]
MNKNITAAIILTILSGVTSLSVAAPRKATIRNIDTSLPPTAIAPESFETDVHKMRENWYLKNYAVMSDGNNTRSALPSYTDDDYINRLQRLNTVIEMPYNRDVRAFINMYVGRKRDLVETMLGLSLYYMPIFEKALDREGLPMELKYLPVIESALNPNAVSKAGATGIWQFMTDTANDLGLEVNSVVDERRDPYKASEAAAKYLKQLHKIYGDWSLAIAAYNCGPGNVNKALRRAGGGKRDFWEIYNFLPAETRSYVPAFIAANYVMNYYNKHNISPVLAAKPIVTDSVMVGRRVHFEQISEVLDIPIDAIRALNPQYRTDIIPGNVKPYPLVLPNLQIYCYVANEDSIVNHNAEKYARREVAEPASLSTNKDSKGEYVQELVVKYHKVKRNETLASIARRYGVTASSIRKANGIGRKVKRGQTLKINTYRRKYIETAPDTTCVRNDEKAAANEALKPAVEQIPDSTDAGRDVKDALDKASTRQAKESANDGTAKNNKADRNKKNRNANNKAAKASKPVTHNIKSGENLSKIADKYGITVDQLKKANNLKNDNIRAGQTLNIPAKAKSTKKSKSGKKRNKR